MNQLSLILICLLIINILFFFFMICKYKKVKENNILNSPSLYDEINKYKPPIRKHFKKNKYNKNEIEEVISAITESFIKNKNISSSIAENISFFSNDMRLIFEMFLYEYEKENNIAQSINVLKNHINNPIFHKWCNSLVLCQKDILYENLLLNNLKEFKEYKEFNKSLKIKYKNFKKFSIGIFILFICNTLFICLWDKFWFYNFINSNIGKLSFILYICITIFAVIGLIKHLNTLKKRGD